MEETVITVEAPVKDPHAPAKGLPRAATGTGIGVLAAAGETHATAPPLDANRPATGHRDPNRHSGASAPVKPPEMPSAVCTATRTVVPPSAGPIDGVVDVATGAAAAPRSSKDTPRPPPYPATPATAPAPPTLTLNNPGPASTSEDGSHAASAEDTALAGVHRDPTLWSPLPLPLPLPPLPPLLPATRVRQQRSVVPSLSTAGSDVVAAASVG